MMTHWTSSMLDEESTAEMEREFLMELRELRNLLEREKEHKAYYSEIIFKPI